MKRRQFLVGSGCATSLVLAGYLENNDDEKRSGYRVVAHPYDTAPSEASTTSVDDPEIDGPIETVVVEAIETNNTATKRLDEEEREEILNQIDELPRYEGDDEFESAAYVTRNDHAAAVFYERDA
ncbi:hypothetical protein C482_08908 [Natrialba chahannaoensis JCM 10990]|uniref:Uncharacterized protein n=1 Tax=Natrialba chahannaoensis JCM 10990 TaxID=1227492 RepID=M0AS35_9EURY|nr:hypothetical protein [Natrialba chahannaoensis]ELZ00194.1 hypothetical protein C482_08908 [Natrialba chahannaoensis JCM 10990]